MHWWFFKIHIKMTDITVLISLYNTCLSILMFLTINEFPRGKYRLKVSFTIIEIPTRSPKFYVLYDYYNYERMQYLSAVLKYELCLFMES